MNLRKCPWLSAILQPLEELRTAIPTNSNFGLWIQQRKCSRQEPTTCDKFRVRVRLCMNGTLNKKTLVAMNLIQEQLSTLSTESTLTLLLQELIAVPMTDISTSSPSTHQLDSITQLQNYDNSNREQGDDADLSHSSNQAMENMRQFDQMDVPGSCRHASNKNYSFSALVSLESPTSPNKAIINLSTCKRSHIKSWKKDTLFNNMIKDSDNLEVVSDREKEQEIQFELQPSQGTIIFNEGSNKSHQCHTSIYKLSFT